MQQRIDEPFNRARYAQRSARWSIRCSPISRMIGSPCAAARFDGQWKLFCLVQNIEKLADYGYVA